MTKIGFQFFHAYIEQALIIIAILFIAAIIMLWVWFFMFKKNIKRRSALLMSEIEEIELHYKMIEELNEKAQREKLEVLSDYRIQEMEIDGKNNAMEQLLRGKRILDLQIEDFTEKIKAYEYQNDAKPTLLKKKEPLYKRIVEEITKLVNKKLADKKDYIELIEHIDEQYLSMLKSIYKGNMSVLYIKYCVCFAIGMEIGEVAECFSIEPSSVHMVRYRLKKKFGLANNDHLNVYLRKLNSTLSALKEANGNAETDRQA